MKVIKQVRTLTEMIHVSEGSFWNVYRSRLGAEEL